MNHLLVGAGGAVGEALDTILNHYGNVIGKHDPDKNMYFTPTKKISELVMHICFPFSPVFCEAVKGYHAQFSPDYTIIHSTVVPGTRTALAAVGVEAFTSPIRGNHSSLVKDLNRYTKYIAPRPPDPLLNELIRFFRLKTCNKPEMLEVAKLLDTSQFGILIGWAQVAERIAKKYGVGHGFIREFGMETNEFYNVRPKITADFCGGSCVRQNIALLKTLYDSKFFDAFIESNRIKAKEIGMEDTINYEGL